MSEVRVGQQMTEASHEEGPEPSVWLDRETQWVWIKIPTELPYAEGADVAAALVFTTDGAQLQFTEVIENSWEVLA